MDTMRLGRGLRVLRHRTGLRQVDVASAAGVSQDTVSRLELGQASGVKLGTLETVARSLGAGLRVELLWRGAALDRLLDERHAALVGEAADRLARRGWEIAVEVSFARYGERGSIDLLGWYPPSAIALVVEVKTELVSLEETLRRLDVKVRLAPRIATERWDRRPAAVARVLVLPGSSTARDAVERHAEVLGRVLPLRGSSLRAWIARPSGPVAGLWFLRFTDDSRHKCASGGPARVRRAGKR
jgi:transcriptional regulator with XRE-family HTH domain